MSRRSWLILTPTLLLVTLALIWSGVWVYVRGEVETQVERAIAREAAQGRQIGCTERRIGGYPFRITVDCVGATLADTRAGQIIEAAEVRAVAQIYRPQHIIVDVTAPLRLREAGPGGREMLAAGWAQGRASVILDGQTIDRVSIALDTPHLVTPAAATPYRARSAELHLRRQPGADPAGALDIALRIGALEGPLALPGFAGASDVEAQAALTAPTQLQGGAARERLRNWTAAGGRLRLALLRLVSQGAALEASGDVGFDPRGRLDGALRLLVHDLERVFRDLVQQRAIPREMLSAVPTLNAIGQPAQIAGRKAIAMPIVLREGLIRIGPVPIGAVPSLF